MAIKKVRWKLKHTIWGLVSSLIILLIGYGTISFINFESILWIGISTIIVILLAFIPTYVVMFGTRKQEPFIIGIPISSRMKISIVTIALVLLISNNVIPVFSDSLNYPARNIISVFLILAMVIFSIGSRTAETIVIGTAVIVVVSASWDFSVEDISMLRKNILVGSFAILGISLTLGKISLLNLFNIIKNQMGLGGKVR